MTADVASPAIESITTASTIARQQPNQPPLGQLSSHTQITEDFDQLKFHAAASLQIQWPPAPAQTSPTTKTDTRLIASPYNAEPHLLDLTTLDTQSRLLALALASFRPVRSDYATAEYLDSFNWQEVFDLVKAFSAAEGHAWTRQSFYVVSFRSRLQDGVDQDRLYALDAYSHQEAVASGGLLKYWFGTKDGERQNLATCECFSVPMENPFLAVLGIDF